MKASMQQVATVAKTAFAVAVGAASVGALRDFIDRTIEATAALQQMSEQTGGNHLRHCHGDDWHQSLQAL
jgi:hypothetical protein